MRGDVHLLRAPRDAMGHEQAGARYAVVLQSDDLLLSTLIVAPTSTSARGTDFRPIITVRGQQTRVLVEQMAAVAPGRLGSKVGELDPEEMGRVASAARRVLALDLPW